MRLFIIALLLVGCSPIEEKKPEVTVVPFGDDGRITFPRTDIIKPKNKVKK